MGGRRPQNIKPRRKRLPRAMTRATDIIHRAGGPILAVYRGIEEFNFRVSKWAKSRSVTVEPNDTRIVETDIDD